MADHTFTFGTHNLHDEAGVPTFFADIVIFTEAIPSTILAKAKARAARAEARLSGYSIAVCHQQPDLVLAWRRRLFRRTVSSPSYERYVDGRPRVTPNRGTAWLPLEHRATRTTIPVVFEHRINAAWPPFVRGEGEFRQSMWRKHTSGTLDLIDRLVDSGYPALEGGDVNTPPFVRGYSLARTDERGTHYDRLALSTPARLSSWSISAPEYLSRKGSDHPRMRVTIRLPRGGA